MPEDFIPPQGNHKKRLSYDYETFCGFIEARSVVRSRFFLINLESANA